MQRGEPKQLHEKREDEGRQPKGPQSLEGDTLMGITYTVLTPFLSPIIFSLRNKELKIAMKKTFLSKLYPEKI
ncbi:hypothetical protein JEQ12_016141 [Ovis aries]|uniref:Uncharacterized protein n=1 Tax=Ovis aries TaxID=9940 RepID=A0A836A7U8_SHEEP|nr:hypothetical protein JEQ12_016141 [Ovis aries]